MRQVDPSCQIRKFDPTCQTWQLRRRWRVCRRLGRRRLAAATDTRVRAACALVKRGHHARRLARRPQLAGLAGLAALARRVHMSDQRRRGVLGFGAAASVHADLRALQTDFVRALANRRNRRNAGCQRWKLSCSGAASRRRLRALARRVGSHCRLAGRLVRADADSPHKGLRRMLRLRRRDPIKGIVSAPG